MLQPSLFPELVPDHYPNRELLTDDYYPYLYPVPVSYFFDLMASTDQRWEVLAGIGIVQQEDETPLQAWRNAVAEASGVARDELDPSIGAGLDLAFSLVYVRKFVLFLA